MNRYRIGIVGAGFGATGHLPALLAHPRFEVVALASPSSAARIARERGVAYAFTSCETMLSGCELDAVTIAAPPFAHYADVLGALKLGKHVVCEKPFALDLADARAMLDASVAAATACGVAHEFRFTPQALAMRELVANRHLDPLRDVELTLLRMNLREAEHRPRGWWFERERGGGLAGAVLSHMIDLASWLIGASPVRAGGFVRTANPQRQDARGTFHSTADDGAFAVVEYPGGIIARLAADATTSVESFTCALHAENRTAVASGPTITDLTLFAVDRDETSELECKPSPYARYASVNANVPLLMELYDEFAKAIDGDPNTLPTFAEAVETQRVLSEIGFGRPRR